LLLVAWKKLAISVASSQAWGRGGSTGCRAVGRNECYSDQERLYTDINPSFSWFGVGGEIRNAVATLLMHFETPT
jgi:hypothetical protein